jgi:hypothetical protein
MKREIDKAKKERAAEKRQRRERSGAPDDGVTSEDGATVASPRPSGSTNEELLLRLEKIHAQFAAEELDFEEFERAKDALIAQLATE